MTDNQMIEEFQLKAKKGDSSFAIAYALLKLAESNSRIASGIFALGNGNAATHFGAIENLAMKLEQAATVLASAIESVADKIHVEGSYDHPDA